jgi:muramidase (phage lysozyme)
MSDKRGGGFMLGAMLAALAYFLYRQTTSASVAPTSSIDPQLGVQIIDWNSPVFTQQSLPPNVAAFLYAIRYAENGDPNLYNQFYGGSFFHDYSNHPVLTGEKQGVPLSDAMCANAGLGPGCVSTAAGAYQINVPTWNDLNTWGDPLPNFSPASQDEAAIRLLKHDGAYDALIAGDLTQAMAIASGRWASLPYSSAGQNPKTPMEFLAFYNDGLQNVG